MTEISALQTSRPSSWSSNNSSVVNFILNRRDGNQLLVKPRHKILFSICSNNGSSDHMTHPSLLMSQFHVLVEAIKSLILTFLHIGCGQTRYAIDILNV